MSSSRSIFISYRRVDSRSVTRKIYDRLAQHFGHGTVFRDLDSIPAGVTFKKYIEGELRQCRILVAVIGVAWLEVTDRNGQRRLDDPQDWVRLEIEWALARQIPVIPLLIDNAKMPRGDELPGLLKALSTRHAARVKHSFWLNPRDVVRLIQDIEFHLGVSDIRPTGPNASFTEYLGQGTTLEMIYVPGGRFLMGSPEDESERYDWEGPQHEVSAPAFFMGKYPVTQRQWRAVAKVKVVERELTPAPSRFKGDDRPVERVSWEEAVEFCRRLSRQMGNAYRLPSEAEWEYACRAGTTTPYSFGDSITPDQASYTRTFDAGTTPVGNFPSNAFGLYDMHGNVFEWCQDHWNENYNSAPTDNSAWLRIARGEYRVIRGGSWGSPPRYCRSAHRGRDVPEVRSFDLGFRVCCSAPRIA